MFAPWKFIALFVLGAILSIVGGIIYGIFPSIMEAKVKEMVQLKEGNMAFDMWRDLPIPVNMRFFFFNVTNVDQILYNSSRPVLKEIGPYVYKETRKKDIIEWNSVDKTVSYRQKKTYFFQKGDSVGSEDDLITIPNVPLVSVVTLADDYPEGQQFGLSLLLSKEQIYVTKKVSELLFDGYFDSFIKTVQSQSGQEIIPNNTFGLFVGLNATDDGIYTVHTGDNDSSKFTHIVSWNNQTELTFWKNQSHCNDINGTDGSQYAPYISKDDTLYIMVSELCRSAFVKFDSVVENQGITNYRFKTANDLFMDPLLNKDNACFFKNGEWYTSGILSISPCKQGAPIALSLPHFFQAEPALLDTVEGLKPDPERHTIFLDVEPTTGIAMNAARRIQVNIIMKQPKSDLIKLNHLPELVHPILWLDEGATIDKANADKFKNMVEVPVRTVKGVSWALIIIGILMALIAIGLTYRKKVILNRTASEVISLK